MAAVIICGCATGIANSEQVPDADNPAVEVDAGTLPTPDAVAAASDVRTPPIVIPDARVAPPKDAGDRVGLPTDAQLAPVSSMPVCSLAQVIPGSPCLVKISPTIVEPMVYPPSWPCTFGCGDVLTGTTIIETRRMPPMACSATAAPIAGFVSSGVPYSGTVVCVPSLADCALYCH